MAADSFIRQIDDRQNRIQALGFVIGCCVCILFSVILTVSGLPRFGESYKIQLDSRINPNSATAASLMRLPGIGTSRATAIVAYRENLNRGKEPRQAFETVDDLQKVRGIGPKTVENISKWLKFE